MMNAKLWIVMLATAVLALGGGAQAASYTWTGAVDDDFDNANNWNPSTFTGDEDDADLYVSGTPTTTTIDPSASGTGNDFSGITFSSSLTTAILIDTGAMRWNDDGATQGFTQDSDQAITIDATFNFRASDWISGGSGDGKLSFNGEIGKGQGSGDFTLNINNPGFEVEFAANFKRGNDNFTFLKTGGGLFLMSGTMCLDTGDGANPPKVDVQGGTFKVTGTLGGSNVSVNGGTFTGGSGTVYYNIDGATADLMDLNSGTLDISGLTLDIQVAAGGMTESEYVVVDYSGGGTLTTTGSAPFFAAVNNLPAGYSIVNDTTNSQIKLVPEPATMVLIGLGGVGLLVRRRRRA